MMSSIPWSSKDPKTNLLDTDEFMMLVPTEAAAADKNQRITVSDVKLVLAPIATQTIHVLNQADLELSILGTNLELADDTILKIFLDDSITLTKPFKLGNDSELEIVGSRTGITITYTGTGALFQNTIPGTDDADDLILKDVSITGDDTNDLFDIEVSTVLINDVNFQDFNNLGILDVSTFKPTNIRFLSTPGSGLVLKNPRSVDVRSYTVINSGATGITALSFLYDSVPSIPPAILINDLLGNVGAGDSMLYLDPTFDISYTITSSRFPTGGGEFYKTGEELAIVSVVNEFGQAEFETGVVNNLVVGQVIVLSGFSESSYNNTFIITAINGNDFEVGILFAINDTGNASTKSINQTDPRVTAFNNPSQPDSMFLAEGRSVGTIPVVSIISTLVPIVKAIPLSGDFEEDTATERFSVDDSTGIITYNGTEPITVLISYELNAEKASGADQNLIISLEINGTPQTKSDINLMATAAPGSFGTSSRKIYAILPDDFFQLFLNNTTNSTGTNVSQLSLVISRQ